MNGIQRSCLGSRACWVYIVIPSSCFYDFLRISGSVALGEMFWDWMVIYFGYVSIESQICIIMNRLLILLAWRMWIRLQSTDSASLDDWRHHRSYCLFGMFSIFAQIILHTIARTALLYDDLPSINSHSLKLVLPAARYPTLPPLAPSSPSPPLCSSPHPSHLDTHIPNY